MNKTTRRLPDADTVKGVAGDEVAPSGNPLISILTWPVKPFCPATVIIVGGLIVPAVMESVEGLTDTLKF